MGENFNPPGVLHHDSVVCSLGNLPALGFSVSVLGEKKGGQEAGRRQSLGSKMPPCLPLSICAGLGTSNTHTLAFVYPPKILTLNLNSQGDVLGVGAFGR